MNDAFSDELKCLAEIEELFENTSLLQNQGIRSHFELLLDLRDELSSTGEIDYHIVESILEDISIVTKEIMVMIETRDTTKPKESQKLPARHFRNH